MLRLIALCLLLANLGYFAWAGGWLRAYGLAQDTQREPQRMQRQIHPERLTLLRGNEALSPPHLPASAPSAPAMSDASAPSIVCLQSGWLDVPRAQTLRKILAEALPQGGWALEPESLPERWMVYMGKFVNAAELAQKRTQLDKLGLPYDVPRNALAPGLSLGVFSTKAQAQVALAAIIPRGVRTARVIQERPATPGFRLRVQGDPTLLDAVRAEFPKGLSPC
ncbi:hypothetical protein [Candidatus Symbiobacter mobilis]|uniref:Sporulation-related protein n=1 Tax=Candidatus Symbiobacter mobilis CR TaxID=946483 RepID=U5NBN7_9BURK|nr:hypothetical protein [Candidatus Symbiobacter mobilis]AGX87653.1 sporulation-related protein [Candidatus Symbiobacter mobilis CR]